MALPGAVNRHHLTARSLESLHDSAERYVDNIADAVDALLKLTAVLQLQVAAQATAIAALTAGSVTPVNPSVIDDLVAFSTTTGAQKDSGKKVSDFATATALTGYVPYAGASTDVDLGTHALTATHIGAPVTGVYNSEQLGSGTNVTGTNSLAVGRGLSCTQGNSVCVGGSLTGSSQCSTAVNASASVGFVTVAGSAATAAGAGGSAY